MTTIELQDIYQGESKYPTFILKDENGTAINLTTLENIRVVFLNDTKKEVLSKYSMVAETGFNNTDFILIAPSAGAFGIRLQSTETIDWCIGVVRIEVDVKKTVSGFSPEFKNILSERIFNVLASKISKL